MANTPANRVVTPGGVIGLGSLWGKGFDPETTPYDKDTAGKAADQLWGEGNTGFDIAGQGLAEMRRGGFTPDWNPYQQGMADRMMGHADNQQQRFGDVFSNQYARARNLTDFDMGDSNIRGQFENDSRLLNAGLRSPEQQQQMARGNTERFRGMMPTGQDFQNESYGNSDRFMSMMPGGEEFAGQAQGLIGGQPDADAYGQRGLGQTRGMNNAYIQQLMDSINQQSKLDMSGQTEETMAGLAAAGINNSGAGSRMMGDVVRSVSEDANRQKIGALAQFAEANAGREAGAINLGSQLGAQGRQFDLGMLNDALGRGQQGQIQQMLQGQNEAAGAMGRGQAGMIDQMLQGQGQEASFMDRAYSQAGDQNMQMRDLALRASGMNDESDRARQQLDFQGQGMGAEMMSKLYAQNQDDYYRSNAGAQDQLDRYRSHQAERLNQQKEGYMQPWDFYKTLITGVSSPGGTQARTNPWSQAAAQAVGGAAQGFFTNRSPEKWD